MSTQEEGAAQEENYVPKFHPYPYTKDRWGGKQYVLTYSEGLGPWDGESLEEWYPEPGDRFVSTESMDMWLPAGHQLLAEKSSGPDEQVDALHIIHPTSEVVTVISLLAQPLEENAWETRLNHALSDHANEALSEYVPGIWGTEVFLRYTDLDVLLHGVDGPRWTVRATTFGTCLNSSHINSVEMILSSMVIHRGTSPAPADWPLPLTVYCEEKDKK